MLFVFLICFVVCRTRYFCYPTSRRVSVFSRLSLYIVDSIPSKRSLRKENWELLGRELQFYIDLESKLRGLKARGWGKQAGGRGEAEEVGGEKRSLKATRTFWKS